jgi:hypothetical protein
MSPGEEDRDNAIGGWEIHHLCKAITILTMDMDDLGGCNGSRIEEKRVETKKKGG